MLIEYMELPFSTFLQHSLNMLPSVADVCGAVLAVLAILTIAFVIDLVLQKMVMPALHRFVEKTENKWDDILFDDKVVVYFSHLLPILVVYLLLPLAFQPGTIALVLLSKLALLVLFIGFCFFAMSAFRASNRIQEQMEDMEDEEEREKPKMHTLNLVFQIIRFLFFALMGAFFVHAAVAEVESGSTAIPAFIFNMIGGTLQNAVLVGHGILMVFIILLASLLDYFIRLVLLPLVADFVKYTETKLDDIIFDDGVVKYLSQLLPVTLIYFLLPLSFDSGSVWLVWMQKLCKVCLVIVSCRMFIAMLSAGRKILEEVEKQGDLSGMKGRPMGIVFQLFRLLLILIGIILVVSIVFDRSPWTLLTGLGASAAILTLVFKDTIIGFVSGLQLSSNDMLRVGDWVTVPSQKANGIVKGVTLHTVKIVNFDKSVSTIPPSMLVNGSFINWRNMVSEGSRRICRPVYIDLSSVHFCSPDELAAFDKIAWLHPLVERIEKNGGKDFDGVQPTNLGVLRYYLLKFIEHYPLCDLSERHMVRQLEPTEHGLPLELFFFVKEVDWVCFEKIQSSVFEQVFAIIPQFHLRVFQTLHGGVGEDTTL